MVNRVAPHPSRCAYLVSQYPALSHVFIESEVQALRDLGWDVQTFSVRPSTLTDHAEWKSTQVLQFKGVRRALIVLGRLIRSRPRAVLTGLAFALRSGQGRPPRGRLWQFLYLAEALVLRDLMSQHELRHVHVHFANNAAAIARLAVVVGEAADGIGSWTWSMAVHGPADFAQIRGADLADKVAAASFVTCISDYCKLQVMKYADPQHWDRLHVVRMGVVHGLRVGDLAEPAPVAPSFRVLFVGRLVPEKGLHVLLDAVEELARLRKTNENSQQRVEVVIIGAGPLRTSLERRAEQLPTNLSLRLLGGLPHAQVVPWYTWAQVFCLPSFAEGLPVVLMEALAHQRAVVTTPVAAIPELIVDGKTGVLVPPGRADLLAAALHALAGDPDRRRRLGAAGRDAVRSRHDVHQNGIILQGLLAHHVGRSTRARIGGSGQ